MALDSYYAAKPGAYFTGERRDILDRLPASADRVVLEIGCGDGATGALARQTGKCGRYVGVELDPDAAAIARTRIDEVHVADIEAFVFPFAPETFGVFIASEVLEHLVDPWKVLSRIRPLMKPGAVAFASSPNVAHRKILAMLVRGDWTLEDVGPMDRTHLRWFTPRSYADMFRACGFKVESVEPVTPPGWKARALNTLTGSRLSHLFMDQMLITARVPR